MATIIKASQSAAAAFHPDELGQRAQSYLDEVRAQAAEMLAAAESDAAQVLKRAQAEGYAAGLAAAEQSIDQRLTAHWSRLEPLVVQAVEPPGDETRPAGSDVQPAHFLYGVRCPGFNFLVWRE